MGLEYFPTFTINLSENVDSIPMVHMGYIPRTQMTHVLEDLTHKMVPVNPPKKRSTVWF